MKMDKRSKNASEMIKQKGKRNESGLYFRKPFIADMVKWERKSAFDRHDMI